MEVVRLYIPKKLESMHKPMVSPDLGRTSDRDPGVAPCMKGIQVVSSSAIVGMGAAEIIKSSKIATKNADFLTFKGDIFFFI